MDKRSASIRCPQYLAAGLSPLAPQRAFRDTHSRALVCLCLVWSVLTVASTLDARPGLQLRSQKVEAPRAAAREARAILEKHHRDAADVLRVRADPPRQRLWVLTLDHVHVYHTRTLELLRRIPLPDWPVADFMCAPGLAIDKTGRAFVSNNVQPQLVEIGGTDFQITERALELISSKRWETGFGALEFGPDGTLFGLTALAGSLFQIDVAAGTATELEASQMDAPQAAVAIALRGGCPRL